MEEKKESLLSFKLNKETDKIEIFVISSESKQPKPISKKKKTAKKNNVVESKKIELQETPYQEKEVIEVSLELLEDNPNLPSKTGPKKEETLQKKIDDQAMILFQSEQAQKLENLLSILLLESNQKNIPTHQTMNKITELASSLPIEALMILCYPQKLNYLLKLTHFEPNWIAFVSKQNKNVEELIIKEQAKHFQALWKRFCPNEPLPVYDLREH